HKVQQGEGVGSLAAMGGPMIVVLKPGEEGNYDVVVRTSASQYRGGEGGGGDGIPEPHQGGTRARVRIPLSGGVFVLPGGDAKPERVKDDDIVVTKGSEETDVSIDDRGGAAQVPATFLETAWDISVGLTRLTWHWTVSVLTAPLDVVKFGFAAL